MLVSAPFVARGADDDSGNEIPMVPNGAVSDAGWALARLNDGGDMASQSFVYPETTNPVRLFLIDTGVAHLAPGSWFAQNPNLKLEHAELISAFGDPATSTAVAHGTRMLSLIAGPETGAALGTPIRLVSFNVYPGAEGSATSSSGRVIDAIKEAIDYQAADPGIPAVICLASGSSLGASSAQLQVAVTNAVAAGITVIVSAGNESANASNYIPSAYGTQAGVICVGASGVNNQHWSESASVGSNSGPAVDLYAPGQDVRTLALPMPQAGSYQLMTGTSPATALATAAAIIELSKNPGRTPAQVEATLKSGALASVSPLPPPAAAPASLVQVQADPEGDSDNDGTADVLEAFFGSNPADAAITPLPMSLTRSPGQAQLGFSVSATLFNAATPYLLTNGGTWKVRWSENLATWQDATGTLNLGTAVAGKIPVTFSMPTTATSCFLRIEVKPAP